MLFKDNRKFAGLLMVLIATLLIGPFFQGSPLGEEGVTFCFSALVVYGLTRFAGSSRESVAIVALGALALGTNLMVYFLPSQPLVAVTLVLNIAFFAFVILFLLRVIFQTREVTADVITGAVCIYLLAGIAFGFIYALIGLLIPHSFAFNEVSDLRATNFMDALSRHFVYFSFETLTSLGYGDVTPVSTPARYVAVMEVVFGQMYIGVLVARLLGVYVTKQPDNLPLPPPE